MKRLLLFFSFCVLSIGAQGQFTCAPNPAFKDSSAGVYPIPFHATLSPKGGINTCAVKGKYYQFDFTVVVGDSLTFSGFKFPLDSVVVNKVTGLPAGLQYGCSPPNCVFKKKTIGCASIYGTPTAAVVPGKFALVIQGAVYLNGSPLGLPISFPNEALAPGNYDLHVLASDTEKCPVTIPSNSTEKLSEQVAMNLHPNPASGYTSVEVTSAVSGSFNMRVSDLLGRTHQTSKVSVIQGANRFEVNVSNLPNGLFVVTLENEYGKVNSRLVVQN